VRLKSLEIKGFKSFADKTVLNFNEGITGVIGPNGCGKSNVIDSIRWVIGEHKISNLRSENLDSLVFNGSKSRSASSMAEVSLTFENNKNLLPTEFSTVTITRKYYKNGESEYRLNDVQCRLKDIHNLFMDTGVSTDSYAIIELGMVDDIIKDKENSRRKMLEQAAGITIYKTRKKEAKNKLDATEQDLARIEDLLFEINNQLKSLENQAKKAEKYFEIKKDYKEVSVELAKAALEGFNVTYKDLNEQQQAEVDKRIELETAIAAEEAALEKEKQAFLSLEKQLQEKQQQFNALVEKVRTTENDKNLTQQRLQYLKERETNLGAFLNKAASQLSNLQESIAFNNLQIEDDRKTLQTLEESLQGLKDQVEQKRTVFDDKRGAIDALRKENTTIQRLQFDAEKTVAIADTSIQNVQRGVMQLEEEKQQRQAQIQQLNADRATKETEQADKNNDLATLQTEQENAKTQIAATQVSIEEQRNQLAEQNRSLDSKKNEYALLKSLVDSMEGYPESVKFLHNNSKWGMQAPLLSDIIYVKENYRAAVENVLEPFLNYYVVDNLQQGLAAIKLLDENKKGKANFFLQNQLTNSVIGTAPQNTTAALSVVEFDSKYQALATHLLGNVFIAETEAAMDADNNNATILEKTGKYVKGKYAITGGSVGIFEGKKIGRAKNLEKLATEIEQQEAVVNKLKEQLATTQSLLVSLNANLKDGAIRQTQQEISQLNNQLFAIVNKLENLQFNEQKSVERLEDLNHQLQTNNDNIASTRAELEKYNTQLENLADKIALIEQDYAMAEQDYLQATNTFNESNLQVTRQQSKVTALQQELDFKTNQITALQLEIETSNTQLTEAAENITTAQTSLEDISHQLTELVDVKLQEQEKLTSFDKNYYGIRTELQEKEQILRSKQKSKEGIDTLLNSIKDRLTDLKLQLAGMKERLHVEFKIDLDAILDEERTTETPLEELQERSEKMRKRLENIGEVNPTAIEAYTEMKKRYEFILEQKNDLVSAKDLLLQTIQEVEATANQQFLDTFNQVRENFQNVFKALFTEDDTADMVLVDPTNLAETGIDIVAKPKGKRPSSIGQLSGGEKTLTATALLFAIYLIKPAPFCILDEVDAPLDDANVGKFTNMIKRFSENSQFIIVTHNKMTMSAVDVIYGVTMQEAGVSKLVPVDFRSLN
jgi:chromosome segregation protein